MGNETSAPIQRSKLRSTAKFIKKSFFGAASGPTLTPYEANCKRFIVDGDVSLIAWQAVIDQLSVLLICPGCFEMMTDPMQFASCKHLVCGKCAEHLQKCPLELDHTGNFHTKFGTIKSYMINTTLNTPQKPLKSGEPWFFVANVIERLPDLIGQLKELFMAANYKAALMLVEEITDEFTCPICSFALGNKNSIAVKPCTHMLCEECLNKWRSQGHNNCPYCKTPIQTRRISHWSSQVEEVLDDSPLGSFERFLLSQIPRLLLQLITLACPSDVQQLDEYKNSQTILYDFLRKNSTITNDYQIDHKKHAILLEGLQTEMLNSRVIPVELSELGEIKHVENLTYASRGGELISIIEFKKLPAAQRCLALNDLLIQGFPVRIRAAPTETSLYEMQLVNAWKLISVNFTQFDAKFLPFIKNSLGKPDLSQEITTKYFQYNKFCFSVMLDLEEDVPSPNPGPWELGNKFKAKIRFQCPVFIKDKILYDLDLIFKDNDILEQVLCSSKIIPDDVVITISDVQVWKKYSLVIENNIVFGLTWQQVMLFNDFRKVVENSTSQEDTNDQDSFCSAKSELLASPMLSEQSTSATRHPKYKQECQIQ